MCCIGKRFLITLLSCFGFVFIRLLRILFLMRVLQDLTINPESDDISALYYISNLIFFIGQMTSLLGGIISNRYGGAVIFGIATLSSAGINFLLGHLLLRISSVWFVVAEFFNGVIQGVMCSSIADVWSRWTSLQHRSKYVSSTLAGYQLAEIIQVTIFYKENSPLEFVAIGTAIWAIVWLLFVKNDPSQDENLSNIETIILQKRLKFLDKKSVALSQYPWLPILKSKSFWALNVAAFINGGNNITNEILQRFLFDYSGSIAISQDMLTFRMSLLIIIITVIVCCIVDYIRNKNIITSSKLKTFVCISFAAQGVILIAFYSSKDYQTVTLLLYLLSLIFKTSAEISIQTIVIDLSPRYASLLNGIQYSFYALGLLCVYVLQNLIGDWLLSDHPLPFIIAVPALYFIGASLYYLFGSTKLQSWNGTPKYGQELEEHLSSNFSFHHMNRTQKNRS